MLLLPLDQPVRRHLLPGMDDDDGQALIERVESAALDDGNAIQRQGFPGSMAVEAVSVRADGEGVAGLGCPRLFPGDARGLEDGPGVPGKNPEGALAFAGLVKSEVKVPIGHGWLSGKGGSGIANRTEGCLLGDGVFVWPPGVPAARLKVFGKGVEIASDRDGTQLGMISKIAVLRVPVNDPVVIQHVQIVQTKRRARRFGRRRHGPDLPGNSPVFISRDENDSGSQAGKNFLEEAVYIAGGHVDGGTVEDSAIVFRRRIPKRPTARSIQARRKEIAPPRYLMTPYRLRSERTAIPAVARLSFGPRFLHRSVSVPRNHERRACRSIGRRPVTRQ